MNKSSDARHDPLDKEYSVIATVERLAAAVFWTAVALSLTVLHIPQSLMLWHELAQICFILFVVGHFGLGLFAKAYLMPRAESRRIRMLVSDGLGVPLESERPSLYYNNCIGPSIARLGANVMENAFFARAVTGEMAKRSRVFIVLYAVVWIVAALWRGTDLGTIALLAQVLFSGEILASHIRLEILRSRCERVFEKLHSTFLHDSKANPLASQSQVLDSYASYEAAKSFSGVLQSTRIFRSLNTDLSSKWKEVIRQLGMDSSASGMESGPRDVSRQP